MRLATTARLRSGIRRTKFAIADLRIDVTLVGRRLAGPTATAGLLRSGNVIRVAKFAAVYVRLDVTLDVATAVEDARAQSNKWTAAALRSFAIQRANGRSSHVRIFLWCKKFGLDRDAMPIGVPGRIDDMIRTAFGILLIEAIADKSEIAAVRILAGKAITAAVRQLRRCACLTVRRRYGPVEKIDRLPIGDVEHDSNYRRLRAAVQAKDMMIGAGAAKIMCVISRLRRRESPGGFIEVR